MTTRTIKKRRSPRLVSPNDQVSILPGPKLWGDDDVMDFAAIVFLSVYQVIVSSAQGFAS
jgi:hypothetical protein